MEQIDDEGYQHMITTSINKLFSDPKSLPKNPFPRIIKQVSSILINDEANQNNK